MTTDTRGEPEIMNATVTKPQSPAEEHAKAASGLLLAVVLLSGIVVVSPFFMPGRNTPGLIVLALALFLPYLVVCWRLLRMPRAKEEPGLAAGIAVIFVVIAAVGCALTIEQRNYLKLGYFAALGFLHGLLAVAGFVAFRQGTSKKPVWRVTVRSLIEPIVYYGIVIFIGLGLWAHH